MSVGIFQNGEYNKVAGNAKDSTAANTTYNNGTSGLQANNVQSAIDTLNSNFINCLKKSDVVNNLTTTTTNVPLSAAQGKVLNDNLNNLIYTKDVQIYFNPNSSRGLWEFSIDSTKFLNAYVVNQGSTEVKLSFYSYESGIYISSSITGQELTVRFVLYK